MVSACVLPQQTVLGTRGTWRRPSLRARHRRLMTPLSDTYIALLYSLGTDRALNAVWNASLTNSLLGACKDVSVRARATVDLKEQAKGFHAVTQPKELLMED